MVRGTIAVEEAMINPESLEFLADYQGLLSPAKDQASTFQLHEKRLLDIHDNRLRTMDAEGVEYMLLSLTSPGCQGESNPTKAERMATLANNYLSSEVKKNPKRFGGLAALSMHNPVQAAQELKRAVMDLGLFGGLVNDFQSTGDDASGKTYFDTSKYDPFWQMVQELDVPIYFHPRYRIKQDIEPGTAYGTRKHMLGAGIQFHLDLSFHIYAICSSGILDKYPKIKIVAGHMGEGLV